MEKNKRFIDRFPILLRTISGFNSCLTVNMTSCIFIWAINEAGRIGSGSWPDPMQMGLMIIGPIIMAWNFVNAKTIINTLVDSAAPEDSEIKTKAKTSIVPKIPFITEQDIIVQKEIFGTGNVILRAIAGFISTHVICFCSLMFTLSIHTAFVQARELPSSSELFLVVVGPIITSWNFVRASNTLSAVISGTDAIKKFREKIANLLMPKQ